MKEEEKEEKVRLSLMIRKSVRDDLYALAAKFPGVTPGDVLAELIEFTIRREDILSSLDDEFADWEETREAQRKKLDAKRKRDKRAKKTAG